MELKAGYKQTEVGVIPKDWEVVSLDSLCIEPMQNGVFYKPSNKGIGIKLINVGDLYKKAPIDSNVLELFNASDYEKAHFKVKDGDLFFTRSSIVASGIAQCNYYVSHQPEAVVFDSHVIRFRPNVNKIAPSYLFNYCSSLWARKYLVSHAKTATMTTIDQGILGQCPILLPTKAEQNAIAKALSDADSLIESLEQLIAKKRNIKQGAMQGLLTGKKRLPGFEGEWQLRRVDEFTSCTAGGTPSTLIPSYWNGSIRWMNSSELHLKFVHEVDGRITEEGLRNSSTRLIPANCVLIGLAGQGRTRGTVAINRVELCTNQSIAAIFPNSSFNSNYLYYNLDSRYRELRELSTGDGGRGGLNLTIINSLIIPFPTLSEQAAIAAVLIDMDAEVEVLEGKLEKARQVKQGMMQELLTGRIRLI